VKFFAHSGGRDFELDLLPEQGRVLVRLGGREIALELDEATGGLRTAFLGDRRCDFGWIRRDGTYSILIDGIEYEVVVRDPRTELLSRLVAAPGADAGAVEVRAPIPGLITKVLARPGEAVRKGRPVLCLDAMKLENEIAAPRDGVLRSVDVRPGQAVEKGRTLFVVE
jgi:acetyl/propionyl-CoA carboxylase alpha subunit